MTNPIVAGGSLESSPAASRMRYFDRNILIKGDPRHQRSTWPDSPSFTGSNSAGLSSIAA